MKINNKSVQGIYTYDSSLEFEKGDFVIHDGSIYICNPKSENTTFPLSPDKDLNNFIPYLSTGKLTLDEFENQYYKGLSNNQEDKLITSDILCQILKRITFGLDFSGIINKEILKNYQSPEFGEFSNNTNTDILDNLILGNSIELNNLIVKVDRELFKGFLITEKPSNVDDIDFKNVILKQYTYEEKSELDKNTGNMAIFRIQEVIDHVFGITMYRYAKISITSENTGISDWKISCPKIKYVEDFSNYVKKVSEKIQNTTDQYFNFKNENFQNKGIGSDGYNIYELNSDLRNKYVTIVISESINESSLITNYSMTIKFTIDSTYLFPNGIQLSIMNNNSLKLQNDKSDRVVKIENIYSRVY